MNCRSSSNTGIHIQTGKYKCKIEWEVTKDYFLNKIEAKGEILGAQCSRVPTRTWMEQGQHRVPCNIQPQIEQNNKTNINLVP